MPSGIDILIKKGILKKPRPTGANAQASPANSSSQVDTRITESGETRITENDNTRILE